LGLSGTKWVFKKRNKIFCSFFKDNTKTPFWIVFIPSSCNITHYFQNYTIITCYTYYNIQNWGKRNIPLLCFHNVLLVNSLLSDKAWQACAQETEKPHPHKLHSFTWSLCASSASSPPLECISSLYDLVWSKIRKSLDGGKAEKLVKIYQLCRAEEPNH